MFLQNHLSISSSTHQKMLKIDKEQIKKLTKNLVEPILKLKSEEVVEGNDILDQIECVVCKSIAIVPMACNICDVTFCMDCLGKSKMHSDKKNKELCPNCKQKFKCREINQRLKSITFEKLRFKHVCKEYKSFQDFLIMTETEKFKQTDEYNMILKKQKTSENKESITKNSESEK